ncbi:MAG: hypothetical protein ACRC33_27200 [Gemmataceae bacterium]
MNANPWKVSDECRETVARLIVRRTHASPCDAAPRALIDAILRAVEADFARAAHVAYEQWRGSKDN